MAAKGGAHDDIGKLNSGEFYYSSEGLKRPHQDTNAPVLKLAPFDAVDRGRGYAESPGVNKAPQHEASSGRLEVVCRPRADLGINLSLGRDRLMSSPTPN